MYSLVGSGLDETNRSLSPTNGEKAEAIQTETAPAATQATAIDPDNYQNQPDSAENFSGSDV
ncbi:hypothetical protein [Spirosoma utsteinense]|uniref:Uncharacterized protein n=1 Tax=Spirosoma utsteinense TaxID=2585773 RepID=A0ABR6W3N4_9BACT|nr:hypothetical protein [Spirosoma utsteinense]MBC3784753.1 hypothetical protein [Spirosoma utsteinense]MBC3791211.1 hypothetical protein [Spirosoma utsteinense]